MELHEAFRSLRIKKGISQWQLARKAGCKQNVLTRLETGKMYRELEDIWIKKLLSAGNLSVDELMREWNIWESPGFLPGFRVKRQ